MIALNGNPSGNSNPFSNGNPSGNSNTMINSGADIANSPFSVL